MLPSANHIRVGFQEMSEEISIVGMNYMLVHHMVNYREPEKPVSKDLILVLQCRISAVMQVMYCKVPYWTSNTGNFIGKQICNKLAVKG